MVVLTVVSDVFLRPELLHDFQLLVGDAPALGTFERLFLRGISMEATSPFAPGGIARWPGNRPRSAGTSISLSTASPLPTRSS